MGRHLATSEDIFVCHNFVGERFGGGTTDTQEEEAGDAAKHFTMHRLAPMTKNYPTLDDNRTEVEKPWHT